MKPNKKLWQSVVAVTGLMVMAAAPSAAPCAFEIIPSSPISGSLREIAPPRRPMDTSCS